MGGYRGKVVFVNLTDGVITEESLPDAIYRKFIGGVGLGARILYEHTKAGCGACPINCGGILQLEGERGISHFPKPEYETLAAFGSMLLNSDLESILKANDLCNRYGMDTISLGTTIAFAMECYEKGIIGKHETEGIDLRWGNPSSILRILEKILNREGFGDILADGVARATERMGKGAEECAIHIHGQEPGFHDPRVLPSRGLGYLVGAAPGRHMTSMASIRLEGQGHIGPSSELKAPEGENECDRRGKIHALASSYSETFSNRGMCLFALSTGTQIPLVELINAFTGWDFTVAEAIAAGRRTLTLRQAFNLREGVAAKDFKLPERLSRPAAMGPNAGRSLDFDKMKGSYYQAMGWDRETGIPSQPCLEELGMKEWVDTH